MKGRSNLPWSVICDIEDDPRGYPAAVEDRLWGSQYARCVFGGCDNDVVDHQVVNMEFEGGATAAFTMNAFTRYNRRETRLVRNVISHCSHAHSWARTSRILNARGVA